MIDKQWRRWIKYDGSLMRSTQGEPSSINFWSALQQTISNYEKVHGLNSLLQKYHNARIKVVQDQKNPPENIRHDKNNQHLQTLSQSSRNASNSNDQVKLRSPNFIRCRPSNLQTRQRRANSTVTSWWIARTRGTNVETSERGRVLGAGPSGCEDYHSMDDPSGLWAVTKSRGTQQQHARCVSEALL